MLKPEDIPNFFDNSEEDLLLAILNRIDAALPTLVQAGIEEKGGATAEAAAGALTAGKNAVFIKDGDTATAALIYKSKAGDLYYSTLTKIAH
jgi:hypothetical protein